MTMRRIALTTAVLGALFATPALAADHEIQMLNRGDAGPMVYEPAFLQIQPGDTVRFVSTDPLHNAETIPGMIPDGAEPFKGRLNEEVEVTFDQEGVYGVKCLPHYGMGMVALIQVGEGGDNVEEARNVRHPGRAGQRMDELFAEYEAVN